MGENDKPYIRDWDEADGLGDLVRVSTATGERTTLADRVRFPLGVSPDGRWNLWFKEGKLWLQDIASGARTDLSAVAGTSFLNVEYDTPGEKSSYGIAGWSSDGRSVLVNAELRLCGRCRSRRVEGDRTSRAALVTKDQVRFRVENLAADDDEPGIDTSKPIVLTRTANGRRSPATGRWSREENRGR